MPLKKTPEIQAEVDDVLAGLEFDAQGKGLFIGILVAFEREFGFVPDRQQLARFLARADNLAATHIEQLGS